MAHGWRVITTSPVDVEACGLCDKTDTVRKDQTSIPCVRSTHALRAQRRQTVTLGTFVRTPTTTRPHRPRYPVPSSFVFSVCVCVHCILLVSLLSHSVSCGSFSMFVSQKHNRSIDLSIISLRLLSILILCERRSTHRTRADSFPRTNFVLTSPHFPSSLRLPLGSTLFILALNPTLATFI
ncbi:hypothetical protein EDB83DRAFT_226044 [Lactarius deliciosus]|nr:hypothetical protein EDB83DRAFT_226044 [Lactarius deliciosus]